MVIVNGYISAKIKTGGGLDENGNPARPSEAFGEQIPCRITTNKRNNIGKQNENTFTVASYEILIEMQPFEAERIKLNQLGKDLGEFSVLWTEYLESVQAVKIVV